VWWCGGALQQSDPLIAERTAGRAAACVQPVGHWRAEDHFRLKLDGIGYGFLIPVFFDASSVEFNLSALFSSAATMVRVPIFLLALLLVRGIPALLYRHVLGKRWTVAAGLLQATSLSFVVAAVQIGTLLGEISAATGAALIGAGLLSVMLFPLLALMLLGRSAAKRNGHER
jgi:Kef-type K+ transport system membrane component KefB